MVDGERREADIVGEERAWAGVGGGIAIGQHDGELGWEVCCAWARGLNRGAGRSLKAGHWVLDLM